MAVYATALIDIDNPSRYDLYTQGFVDIWKHYKGEILAFDDDPIQIEGKWPSARTVIMRFPSEADFNAWYGSPEYKELVKHRHAASKGSISLIREFKMPAVETE